MVNNFLSSKPKRLVKTKLALLAVFVFAVLAPRPSFAFEVRATAVTLNDPGFTVNTQDIDKQWGLAKTGFNVAWIKSTGSLKNTVAVIDTGIDATHEDLQTINFVPGFDFITKQPILGRTNSDDNGHGTLIAGILGATANNGLGIAGTNQLISIMPLKALDSSGKGESSTIAEAIVWAADHGANIINLSLGGIGLGHDAALSNSISYAFNKNVVIIAAAGNDSAATGNNLDKDPVYPICDDNGLNMVIGVAATDQNDLKPVFSNYGKNCIDVTAPGKRILSTINHDPFTKAAAPNSYAYGSGTSLAVPFVSGEAALIRSVFPDATSAQIRDRILASADDIDNLNLTQCGGTACKGLLGAGRINVNKSLDLQLVISNIQEGDLVRVENTNLIYQIIGGQKRLASTFVLNQLFSGSQIKTVSANQLTNFLDGPYVTPQEGTLVKLDNDPAVYIISKGQKVPITYDVFKQRKLSFGDVKTVSFPELNSWVTGSFLPPIEGTLVRAVKSQTVYWVVGQSLRPINYAFYIERGLNIFPILYVPDRDIPGYSKGEAYIR